MVGNVPCSNLLGSATNISSKKKVPDMSTLRPPILTSLTGMKQAIHAIEGGSLEVRNILFNEVNVIYECRVCFGMFRSLSNLVAHKRNYCQSKSDSVSHKFEDEEDKENRTTVIVKPEDTDCFSNVNTWNMENYSPSMELIQSSGILQDILSEPLIQRLSPKKSIHHITRKLNALSSNDSRSLMRSKASSKQASQLSGTILLEPMFNTSNALYQTWRVSGDSKGETIKDIQSKKNVGKFLDKHIMVTCSTEGDASLGVKSDIGNLDDKPTDNQSMRYHCVYCSSSVKEWKYLRRHLINVHGKDADYVNANKEWFLKKAVLVNQEQAVAAVNPKTAPARSLENISKPCLPVKPLQVDVKKLNPGLPGLCQMIQNEQECPLLKTKQRPIIQEPEQPAVVKPAPESEIAIPLEVERKIMEFIDRRRLQCTACYKKFRRTYLAQQHVAAAHLSLKRFKCRVCGHGAWMKGHVLKHVENTHRKLTPDSVEEVPVDKYFERFAKKDVIEEPQGLIRFHNLENFIPAKGTLRRKPTNDDSSLCNGIKENEAKVEDDMVPVSLITGIKSQIRSSIEEKDSDEEISFKKGANIKRKRLSSPDHDSPKKGPRLIRSRPEVNEESVELFNDLSVALTDEVWSPSRQENNPTSTEINRRDSFRSIRSHKEDSGFDPERSGRSKRQRSITSKL